MPTTSVERVSFIKPSILDVYLISVVFEAYHSIKIGLRHCAERAQSSARFGAIQKHMKRIIFEKRATLNEVFGPFNLECTGIDEPDPLIDDLHPDFNEAYQSMVHVCVTDPLDLGGGVPPFWLRPCCYRPTCMQPSTKPVSYFTHSCIWFSRHSTRFSVRGKIPTCWGCPPRVQGGDPRHYRPSSPSSC